MIKNFDHNHSVCEIIQQKRGKYRPYTRFKFFVIYVQIFEFEYIIGIKYGQKF